jgi:hypothetical protein
VAKIELGLRQVTDIEVTLLADALGVDVAWLFGIAKSHVAKTEA